MLLAGFAVIVLSKEMDKSMSRFAGRRTLVLAIAIVGIIIELAVVLLLAARILPVPVGIPLLIAGLFMAFVPMLARSRDGASKPQA
jgi:hypothetical protein